MKLVLFYISVLLIGFSVNGQVDKAQFDSLSNDINRMLKTNIDSAITLLAAQNDLAKKINDTSSTAWNMYMYSRYWNRKKNSYDSIMYYLNAAYEHYALKDEFGRMSEMQRLMAHHSSLVGDREGNAMHVERSLSYAIKSEDPYRIGYALISAGLGEMDLNNDTEALNYFYKSKGFWNQIEDPDLKSKYNPDIEIAAIHYFNEEYEKAIDPIRSYINTCESVGAYWKACQWTNNLASVYLALEDTAAAIQSSFLAIDYAKRENHKYGMASACHNLAEIYIGYEKYDSAKYYFDQIDLILPTIEEADFSALIENSKGDYFLKINELTSADRHYKSAFKIWQKLNNHRQLAAITLKLSNIEERIGNYEGAFTYMNLHAQYKDSVNNRDKIEEFKELEMTYAFNQEQMADSLKNIQVLQSLELGFQKDIASEQRSKNILIFGLVLICLVVLFVFIAYRRNKRQKELLNEKNVKIAEALSENQLLLKEVHHRVKNNFQIISSLLELQSKGIEDEKALALALEGQNRIKSMSLIHQRLYQNDDLLIDFSDYLEKLVGDLASAYDRGKQLQLEIDAGNHVFDIDTAIPLGLIINELVTNAFKYGFGKHKHVLKVNLRRNTEGVYQLEVSDNGAGIPETVDLKKVKSLGLRLVKRLSKQLHGSFEFERSPESKFIVKFKDTEHRLQVD
jgi:two-component sensor histidine kinase/surface antigen